MSIFKNQYRFYAALISLMFALSGCGEVISDDENSGDIDGDADYEMPEIDYDGELFSFFVTSLESLQALSGNQNGFGGDLRYGETGDGAGLHGADKICAEIAERSMEGSSVKEWRAFLCATDDGDGNQANAIDRIGDGPWYDRLGRLVAPDIASLLYDRPQNGDSSISDDLPNEFGVPNHQPDPTQPEVDNHHMLTGADENGELFGTSATCNDWTSSTGSSGPRVGLSWPRTSGGGGIVKGGGMSDQSATNWISALNESGCEPGVNLSDSGGTGDGSRSVGSSGGYGGFYCFALVP